MNAPALNAKLGVCGVVQSLVAIKPDGTRRHLAGPFKNLVVDAGIDFIFDAPTEAFGTGYNYARCQVSTSNVEPTETDTTLDTVLATANALDGTQGTGTRTYVPNAVTIGGVVYDYVQITRTYRFGTGVAAGILAKLAILPTNSGNLIFSATLIKDGGGSPITVEVLPDEILDATYSVRMYVRRTDVVTAGVEDGDGNTYTVTMRPSSLSNIWFGTVELANNASGQSNRIIAYTGTIGTVTQTPSGGNSSSAVLAWANTYSPGQRSRDVQKTFGESEFTNTILAVNVTHSWGGFQYGFSPGIPKIAGKMLTLRFRLSIDRFDPTP